MADKAVETEAVAVDSVAADSVAAPVVEDTKAESDLWTPVKYEDAGSEAPISQGSLWYIFFTCFLGGLVALFTPVYGL